MANELLAAPATARAAIGTKETVRRRLRRQKRGLQPREPATLSDIDLPDDFKSTGEASPEEFLIHDSGPAAPKWMLVFAFKEQLRHLSSSDRYVRNLLFKYVSKRNISNNNAICAVCVLIQFFLSFVV